jgi:hypothetical protein
MKKLLEKHEHCVINNSFLGVASPKKRTHDSKGAGQPAFFVF